MRARRSLTPALARGHPLLAARHGCRWHAAAHKNSPPHIHLPWRLKGPATLPRAWAGKRLLNGVGLAIVIDDVCVLDRSDMALEAISADDAADACGADLLQGDCDCDYEGEGESEGEGEGDESVAADFDGDDMEE